MLRLIVFIVVGAVIYLAATNQLESTLVRWELADKEMRKISCTQIAKANVGRSMRNLFGASFRILSIERAQYIERKPKKHVCSGIARLDNGSTTKVKMTFEELEDGQRFFSIESQ